MFVLNQPKQIASKQIAEAEGCTEQSSQRRGKETTKFHQQVLVFIGFRFVLDSKILKYRCFRIRFLKKVNSSFLLVIMPTLQTQNVFSSRKQATQLKRKKMKSASHR